jgi:cell division septal protein FtsQ
VPDPRIVARRIAVKRDEGRRRLRRVGWAALAVALLAGAALATRTPLLDVDHVRVEGASRVAIGEVLEAAATAGAEPGDPLVGLSEASVARAVEALPGVADASVERRWPGTVVVTLVERRPVASVAVGDRLALVAADGVVVEVLGVLAGAPVGLPLLEGTAVDAEPGAVADAPDLLSVAAALPPAVVAHVSSVAAGPAAEEVSLRLGDGVTARLGPVADLGAKLNAVATVLEQVDLACVLTIDVRVPSAPALTPRPGCAA